MPNPMTEFFLAHHRMTNFIVKLAMITYSSIDIDEVSCKLYNPYVTRLISYLARLKTAIDRGNDNDYLEVETSDDIFLKKKGSDILVVEVVWILIGNLLFLIALFFLASQAIVIF